ncbi:hypothetical protein ACFC1T_09305 [Kitasatospora sp. NPDC056076]|uniref:hypothetical protein n=1 Tax=Kitasatospora sp. NPDC056076 TaxID=3345703 RepID=UPI0035E0EC93
MPKPTMTAAERDAFELVQERVDEMLCDGLAENVLAVRALALPASQKLAILANVRGLRDIPALAEFGSLAAVSESAEQERASAGFHAAQAAEQRALVEQWTERAEDAEKRAERAGKQSVKCTTTRGANAALTRRDIARGEAAAARESAEDARRSAAWHAREAVRVGAVADRLGEIARVKRSELAGSERAAQRGGERERAAVLAGMATGTAPVGAGRPVGRPAERERAGSERRSAAGALKRAHERAAAELYADAERFDRWARGADTDAMRAVNERRARNAQEAAELHELASLGEEVGESVPELTDAQTARLAPVANTPEWFAPVVTRARVTPAMMPKRRALAVVGAAPVDMARPAWVTAAMVELAAELGGASTAAEWRVVADMLALAA